MNPDSVWSHATVSGSPGPNPVVQYAATTGVYSSAQTSNLYAIVCGTMPSFGPPSICWSTRSDRDPPRMDTIATAPATSHQAVVVRRRRRTR